MLDDFVKAVVALDVDAIGDCLAPEVRLRALLPGGVEEASGRVAVAGTIRRWFEPATEAELLECDAHRIGDRDAVSYRVRAWPFGEGSAVVEQHAFCDVGEDGIEQLEVLCSGFRPTVSAAATVHHFDAGMLGCTDGLAGEFRRRIRAIPVGDVLEVVARDPSAREDLPSLARLMGHNVLSVEAPEEGCLVFRMERGR